MSSRFRLSKLASVTAIAFGVAAGVALAQQGQPEVEIGRAHV